MSDETTFWVGANSFAAAWYEGRVRTLTGKEIELDIERDYKVCPMEILDSNFWIFKLRSVCPLM